MDVTTRIRLWALGRPRVLLIDAAGSQRLRWLLEAELDRRHWPLALSPADTDLVLVLGRPGPELAAATDLLWLQVPQPRHRREIGTDADLSAQLDSASAALINAASHAEPGQAGAQAQLGNDGPDQHEHGKPDEHNGHGAGQETEHAEHGGHGDHHMHHGGDVAGLPMADTAPDRDGLMLDVLRVTLGPVLPGWPTGLVLTGSMQGDVLSGVELTWVDTDQETGGAAAVVEVAPRAVAMDHLARFLLVAGWPTRAAAARRSRHALTDSNPSRATEAQHAAARVARRIGASASLRWSVKGIGTTDCDGTTASSGPVAGDVWDRVRRWCDVAAGDSTAPVEPPRSLAEVSALLEGCELATARLVLASVDLQSPARAAPMAADV